MPFSLRQNRETRRQPISKRASTLFALLCAGLFLIPAPVRGEPSDSSFADRFAGSIEQAHGIDAWRSQHAVQADVAVSFGGKPMFEATMTFDTPVGRVRAETPDGTVMVFDGQDAWVAPADSEAQGAWFQLLTWPYFVAAPMKLRDPGTHLRDLGTAQLREGQTVPIAKLTFDSGVGDSPDDWYILYRDPKNDRLVGMAYIVTFGKPKAEAEKEPHAITFEGFKTVDGVVISTHWRFWNWNHEKGIHGEPIGEVKLTNLRFVTPDASAFTKPENSRQDALPVVE